MDALNNFINDNGIKEMHRKGGIHSSKLSHFLKYNVPFRVLPLGRFFALLVGTTFELAFFVSFL